MNRGMLLIIAHPLTIQLTTRSTQFNCNDINLPKRVFVLVLDMIHPTYLSNASLSRSLYLPLSIIIHIRRCMKSVTLRRRIKIVF